jgi:Lar family restriction alleviation protein
MAELKPCPFCGSENLIVVKEGPLSKWVACMDCYAQGPVEFGEEEQAISAWNKRS